MKRNLRFALLVSLCLLHISLFAEELRIVSTPAGATVEIDGKVLGITPYTSKKMPGGYFHKRPPSSVLG
ncbi:MAG: PEGA domain-containing protein [Candidatus Sulfotelmatobacter sp.]